jgi:hypothetical protein
MYSIRQQRLSPHHPANQYKSPASQKTNVFQKYFNPDLDFKQSINYIRSIPCSLHRVTEFKK